MSLDSYFPLLIYFFKMYSECVFWLCQEKYNNWKSMNNIKGSTVKRNTDSSFFQYGTSAAVGSKAYTSRSEPDMARQRATVKRAVSPHRLASYRNSYGTQRTTTQPRTPRAQPQSIYKGNGTVQTKTGKHLVRSTVTTFKTLPNTTVTDSAPKKKDVFVWVEQNAYYFFYTCMDWWNAVYYTQVQWKQWSSRYHHEGGSGISLEGGWNISALWSLIHSTQLLHEWQR